MANRVTTYSSKKKRLSNPITVLITVFVCTGCWFIGFIESAGIPIVPDLHATPLWRKVCLFFADKDFSAYLCGFLLLLFISFVIQRGSYLLLIIKGKTLFPFLFYFTLNSTNPNFFPIQSSSVAMLFLLAAVFELFNSYQKAVNAGRIYNASVYIAVGSLFWIYLLWFIPLFWFGMYHFRLLNFRSFMASLLGLFTTYWFVLVWCVWRHDYSYLLIPAKGLLDFDLVFINETIQVGRIIPFCFIMIVLVLVFVFNKLENTLRTRQYLSFLFVFSVCSFLLLFLYSHDTANILALFYLPTSVLIAYFFTNRYDLFSFFIYYGILFLLVLLFGLRL